MSDDRTRPLFPELRFDNANNSAHSLRILGEFVRRGDVRVFQDGIDGTGKLVLRVQLPGSETIQKRTTIR